MTDLSVSCGKAGECITNFYVFTNLASRTLTFLTTYTSFNRIQFRSNNVILYFPSTSIWRYRRWKDLLNFFVTIKDWSKSLINSPRSLTFGWYVATKGISFSKDFLTGGFLPKTTLSVWSFATFYGQPLAKNHCFISQIWTLKSFSDEQILLTLNAWLYGIDTLMWWDRTTDNGGIGDHLLV